ncbi:hypothetical protein PIB30_039846 [Stylosanthes scabra]|uniref:Uncharacterized protein n=1 Tax=Stylosanthes scabra TaxID=79078 RepID=A0ABU6TF66_9FABA|nr:hypothetical protein [Stylosanthes scabra]
MFQRPRSVALEYEKPRTYGMVLIYPLDRLVECGSAGYVTTIIFGISGVHRDMQYLDPRPSTPFYQFLSKYRLRLGPDDWSSGKYERWSSSASSGSVGLGYDNRSGELTVAYRNRHSSYAFA